MSKKAWREKTLKQMHDLGIEDPAYGPTVEALIDILDQRDKVAKEYRKSGSKPVIEYTNKLGMTNMIKNPLLTLWESLNKSALAYWRELGLTPASYKKLSGNKPKTTQKSGLAEALSKLEED